MVYPTNTERSQNNTYLCYEPGTAFTTAHGVTLRAWATWPMGGATPARTARDLIRTAFGDELGCDDDTTDRACEAAFELVTNAFEHGTGPVWVSIWLAFDSIAVHVSDGAGDRGMAFPPYRPGPVRQMTLAEFDAITADADPADLEHHRGLQLVCQHARGRCGISRGGNKGKSVWFALKAPWHSVDRRPERGDRSMPGRVVPLNPQRPMGHPSRA